jgi:DNA-binding NarL/FixJ family response regulator
MRALRGCAVCGKEAPVGDRVSVALLDGPIWVHERCATRLAAGVLEALHQEVSRKPGPRAPSIRRTQLADHYGLTPREYLVLQRMAAGRSNREIGDELGIGYKTVRNMVSQVLAKLDASNRAEAAAIAVREGLLDEVGR